MRSIAMPTGLPTKVLIVMLLAAANFGNAFAQDTIRKVSGEEIIAKVLGIRGTQVQYKKYDNLDGPTYMINNSQVESIAYGDRSRENANGQSDMELEAILKKAQKDSLRFISVAHNNGSRAMFLENRHIRIRVRDESTGKKKFLSGKLTIVDEQTIAVNGVEMGLDSILMIQNQRYVFAVGLAVVSAVAGYALLLGLPQILLGDAALGLASIVVGGPVAALSIIGVDRGASLSKRYKVVDGYKYSISSSL